MWFSQKSLEHQTFLSGSGTPTTAGVKHATACFRSKAQEKRSKPAPLSHDLVHVRIFFGAEVQLATISLSKAVWRDRA